MMDIFCEYILKKGKTVKDYLYETGIVLAACIFTYLMLGISQYTFGAWLLLICIAWYGVYMFIKFRGIEYEYTLTNSEMDIDRIKGKSKRKRIISVNFKNVELCANVNDKNYYDEEKDKERKILDFTGISENDIYFADFTNDKGKIRMYFQPSEKMKEGLGLVNPRNVHIS